MVLQLKICVFVFDGCPLFLLAITLPSALSGHDSSMGAMTELGSMLFKRSVSGTR